MKSMFCRIASAVPLYQSESFSPVRGGRISTQQFHFEVRIDEAVVDTGDRCVDTRESALDIEFIITDRDACDGGVVTSIE